MWFLKCLKYVQKKSKIINPHLFFLDPNFIRFSEEELTGKVTANFHSQPLCVLITSEIVLCLVFHVLSVNYYYYFNFARPVRVNVISLILCLTVFVSSPSMTASPTATNPATPSSLDPKVTARGCCRPTSLQLTFESECHTSVFLIETFVCSSPALKVSCTGNVQQPFLLLFYLGLPPISLLHS